jgi:hypothetical protein
MISNEKGAHSRASCNTSEGDWKALKGVHIKRLLRGVVACLVGWLLAYVFDTRWRWILEGQQRQISYFEHHVLSRNKKKKNSTAAASSLSHSAHTHTHARDISQFLKSPGFIACVLWPCFGFGLEIQSRDLWSGQRARVWVLQRKSNEESCWCCAMVAGWPLVTSQTGITPRQNDMPTTITRRPAPAIHNRPLAFAPFFNFNFKCKKKYNNLDTSTDKNLQCNRETP